MSTVHSTPTVVFRQLKRDTSAQPFDYVVASALTVVAFIAVIAASMHPLVFQRAVEVVNAHNLNPEDEVVCVWDGKTQCRVDTRYGSPKQVTWPSPRM